MATSDFIPLSKLQRWAAANASLSKIQDAANRAGSFGAIPEQVRALALAVVTSIGDDSATIAPTGADKPLVDAMVAAGLLTAAQQMEIESMATAWECRFVADTEVSTVGTMSATRRGLTHTRRVDMADDSDKAAFKSECDAMIASDTTGESDRNTHEVAMEALLNQ